LKIAEEYRKSGKITKEVRALVSDRVRPGATFVDVCDFVEDEVRTRGGSPAFPTGIGVNQVTAHYAPQQGDASAFAEGDLVKVDLGVHVDGYVTDTAVTVALNPDHQLMLEATQKALEAAIETAKRDPRMGEIGRGIYREASRFGFKTIENLTGHTVDRYTVHAGKSIPNLYMPGLPSLKTGEVFAVEPFLTLGTAAGYVVDGPTHTIFSLVARKRTGRSDADAFAGEVWDERKTLPFTPRWYAKKWGRANLDALVEHLVAKRVLRAYPTLVEASGNPVAQFEHTMALVDGTLEILT